MGPKGGNGRGRRLWLALAGGLVAIAAIAAVLLSLGSGGAGQDGEDGAPRTKAASRGGETASRQRPAPLSRSELIVEADAICDDSQSSFEEARADFPEGKSEESPDVAYSEALAGISSPAVKRFESLDPPPSVRRTYNRYVDAQRRVHQYDVQALRAARAEHLGEYLAARERRDNGQQERYELAREIGLKTCSASPG